MIKHKQLLALLGAGALVMGTLAATGTALAADNTQYWQGNGTTNGEIDTNDCSEDSTAHQLWIWTGTGSNVTLHIAGDTYAGVLQGNGSYHFATDWYDINTLTPGNGGNVFVTYDGAADGNAVLTLSHGCPGEQVSPPPSEQVSPPPSEQVSPPPSEEVSAPPSFSITQFPFTNVPSEPSTDSIGTNGTSAPADGAWLLVVALGVLLASIVMLTPARAKSRR